MNRARAITSAMVATIGTVAAAGVLLFTGSGSAAGSTVPSTIPVVFQNPTTAPMAPFLPTMVGDEWKCNEISCSPVVYYFGH